MQVYAVILVTYFLVTGGIVYDIINEPPSIGIVLLDIFKSMVDF